MVLLVYFGMRSVILLGGYKYAQTRRMDTDSLNHTVITLTTAFFGAGGIGSAITLWVAYRGQKSTSYISAQKNVYEAFDELAKSQQTRLTQLNEQIVTIWKELETEKKYSRNQDKALLACERSCADRDNTIVDLNVRIQGLERIVVARRRARNP